MGIESYKYIYGPVSSWRLGSSLGIDPVSKGRKVCSFDCVYCQIGKNGLLTDERHRFVKVENIIEELNSLPPVNIDHITFSGAGEPTLASNLGVMIRAIKKVRRENIAVITNSSLLHRKDVRDDLLAADLVVAKIDACKQKNFAEINRPIEAINIEHVVLGIKLFREVYKGKLALQIMFIEQNKSSAQEIAQIVKEISPEEVQINTPLRSCEVKPLTEVELDRVETYFREMNAISAYKAEKKKIQSISNADTLKRRGK